MDIFVYYDDDYADCGGVGLELFASKLEAAQFIQRRMATAEKPNLSAYRIIEGREIAAKVVEVAARIDIP